VYPFKDFQVAITFTVYALISVSQIGGWRPWGPEPLRGRHVAPFSQTITTSRTAAQAKAGP